MKKIILSIIILFIISDCSTSLDKSEIEVNEVIKKDIEKIAIISDIHFGTFDYDDLLYRFRQKTLKSLA